jgi:hypothetical protein
MDTSQNFLDDNDVKTIGLLGRDPAFVFTRTLVKVALQTPTLCRKSTDILCQFAMQHEVCSTLSANCFGILHSVGNERAKRCTRLAVNQLLMDTSLWPTLTGAAAVVISLVEQPKLEGYFEIEHDHGFGNDDGVPTGEDLGQPQDIIEGGQLQLPPWALGQGAGAEFEAANGDEDMAIAEGTIGVGAAEADAGGGVGGGGAGGGGAGGNDAGGATGGGGLLEVDEAEMAHRATEERRQCTETQEHAAGALMWMYNTPAVVKSPPLEALMSMLRSGLPADAVGSSGTGSDATDATHDISLQGKLYAATAIENLVSFSPSSKAVIVERLNGVPVLLALLDLPINDGDDDEVGGGEAPGDVQGGDGDGDVAYEGVGDGIGGGDEVTLATLSAEPLFEERVVCRVMGCLRELSSEHKCVVQLRSSGIVKYFAKLYDRFLEYRVLGAASDPNFMHVKEIRGSLAMIFLQLACCWQRERNIQREQQWSKQSGAGPAGSWPPTLHKYVERAFAQVTRGGTAEDKKDVEEHLKKLIADAVAINGLWTHDWEKEPLLRLRPSKIEAKHAAAAIAGTAACATLAGATLAAGAAAAAAGGGGAAAGDDANESTMATKSRSKMVGSNKAFTLWPALRVLMKVIRRTEDDVDESESLNIKTDAAETMVLL